MTESTLSQDHTLKLLSSLNLAEISYLEQQFSNISFFPDRSMLLIDMSRVSWNGTHLMNVLPIISKAHTLNLKVVFHGVTQEMRILFELLQIDQIFEVFEHSISDEAVG